MSKQIYVISEKFLMILITTDTPFVPVRLLTREKPMNVGERHTRHKTCLSLLIVHALYFVEIYNPP